MAVFTSSYAGHYDQLYAEKDYGRETALIEETANRYASNKPRKIIDIGCGTGSHSLLLAAAGFEMTGIDRSESMIALAQSKVANLPIGSRPVFKCASIQDFQLEAKADMAIMMFAVISYLTTNEDLLEGLKNIRANLAAGALLVFDFWSGPAVLSVRPTERMREINTPNGLTVLRSAKTTLDINAHTADVTFKLWNLRGSVLESVTEETHTMRYLFPQEMRLFLNMAGFSLENLTAFPSQDKALTDNDWNAFAVARAI